MHKNFAKTAFLGKSITYLPECHSTNDHLAQLAEKRQVNHGDILIADYQSGGKGQRGNTWTSERGKNLLFSFFLKPDFLQISDVYLLNIITGLAISKLLDKVFEEEISSLKWPNDAYVDDKKVAGVLIETSLRKELDYVILGVGLNVNQTHFPLPTATSLKIETGRSLMLTTLLETFCECFEHYYGHLEREQKGLILRRYHEKLYWRGEKHIYRSSGEEFEAVLIGIDKNGNLILEYEGKLKHFRTKEVEFIS